MTEQEIRQAKYLTCKNTAVQAGWVLADVKNVCHFTAVNYIRASEMTPTRRHIMVCGFAHEATGQMWVTEIWYRTEILSPEDPEGTERVINEVLCVDPELQAWADLVSALSHK